MKSIAGFPKKKPSYLEDEHNSSKYYLALLGFFLAGFIAAVTLIDVSDIQKNGGYNQTEFGIGFLLFVACTCGVYMSSLWFFSKMVHRVHDVFKDQPASQGVIPEVFLNTVRVYYPLYVTVIFVMLSYAAFLIFHLERWSVALGLVMLAWALVFAGVFLYTSARNIKTLAESFSTSGAEALVEALKKDPMVQAGIRSLNSRVRRK